MKNLGFLMLLLAISALLSGNALAQLPAQLIGGFDTTNSFGTYYSNANTANAPDATIRIMNTGGSLFAPDGNLYANIYVFDDSEELQECCSCLVTPDGLLSESVNKNLTANPLTGIKPQRGIIKILTADNGDPTQPVSLDIGLTGWATHIQKGTSGFYGTEASMHPLYLPGREAILLPQLCHFDALLSGKPCTCTPEDQDF